ncbi:hypothetical protein F5Y16DRAFT_138365 [Xylariaceae sp. FL0255]|nr:hypothetical protein F5Y16DRAFT_138365 [Xylariaceae sp. FL0255]
MPLAPPEDGVYRNWPECEQIIQAHAAREGYAVIAHKKNKSKDTNTYKRFQVRCAKSGKYRERGQNNSIRKRTSNKTDCPFAVTINIRDEGCYLQVMNPNHNHPPSTSPSDFPQHRKMTEDHKRFIEAGAIAHKSTRQIFSDIQRAYPHCHFRMSDVGNAIQTFKRNAKKNATGVQAILYKLAEREDVFTFTLERDGVLEGAFWVPHWSSHLWMRSSGTPDILVMLTSHIVNRPVLPILEMNSVLSAANVVSGPPRNPHANIQNPQANPHANLQANPQTNTQNFEPHRTHNPYLSSFIDNTTHHTAPPASALNSESPQQQGVPNGAVPSNDGLSSTLGAGYAILPDRNDATLVWLLSAVEKLRQRIPNCPKPAFVTLTDFQTAEKNVLAEVSKGGILHRQNHVIFGRVLVDTPTESAPRHGVSSRKASRRSRNGRNSHAGENVEEGSNEGESQEDEEEDSGSEDDDQEDDDMEEDNDPDEEIARQLGGNNGYTVYSHNNHHQQIAVNHDGRHSLAKQAMQAHNAMMSGRTGHTMPRF